MSSDDERMFTAMRARPRMYLGTIGFYGVHGMLRRVLDRLASECAEGDRLVFGVDGATCTVRLTTGRDLAGLRAELRDLELARGQLGMLCLGAFSKRLEWSIVDAQGGEGGAYARGERVEAPPEPPSGPPGLLLTYDLDPEIFEVTAFRTTALDATARHLARAFPAAAIGYEGGTAAYAHGTLDRALDALVGPSPRVGGLRLQVERPGIAVDLAIAWLDEERGAFEAWANAVPLRSGSHVEGLTVGVYEALARHARALGWEEAVFRREWRNIARGLVGLMRLTLAEPRFSGCDVGDLEDIEVEILIRDEVADALSAAWGRGESEALFGHLLDRALADAF